jgi:hypothetical protein
MEIKPLSAIGSKWSKNASASGAGDAYRDGVNSPRRSWAASASAADQARKDGLAAADARNAFVEGVNKAGDQKWKANASTLGPSRFRQGVANAQPAFSSGFSKYHQVISSTELPPRGPKGSPDNIERVRVVAAALHAARVA